MNTGTAAKVVQQQSGAAAMNTGTAAKVVPLVLMASNKTLRIEPGKGTVTTDRQHRKHSPWCCNHRRCCLLMLPVLPGWYESLQTIST
eukprot:1160548-Pelagomonas_calceolata.AAC.10